jgi:CheY-like chemotaxis protein
MVSTFESAEAANLLRVVLVDARPERRELVRHLIEGTGLADGEVGEASSSEEAVELLGRAERDVAVVEIQMPVAKGLETVAALRRQSADLRIVVCSFHADPATKEMALAWGADAWLDKPISSESFKSVFRGFFPKGRTVVDVDAQAPEQPQPTGP